MKLVVMFVMTLGVITDTKEGSDFSKGALWDCRVGEGLTLFGESRRKADVKKA